MIDSPGRTYKKEKELNHANTNERTRKQTKQRYLAVWFENRHFLKIEVVVIVSQQRRHLPKK
jgi:hypothetical protein